MRLAQRAPASDHALDPHDDVRDDAEWQPKPGKVTRTMRLARELGASAIRRYATGGPPQAVADVLARLASSGAGERLPAPLAAELGGALGKDLDAVRVHTDGTAATAARDLNASAFAIGDHVYFAAGAYQPDTEPGRRLIAHEVAHTVQQHGAAGDAVEVSEPGDAHERDADRFADAFAARPRAAAPAERSPIIAPADYPMVAPVGYRAISRYPDGYPDRSPPPAASPAPAAASGSTKIVQLNPIPLFKPKSFAKDWPIVDKFVPITKGVVLIGDIPVTYGLEGAANLKATASGALTGVIDDAEMSLDANAGVPWPGPGHWDLDPFKRIPAAQAKGTLKLHAEATAGIEGSTSLKAEAAVIDIFAVGGKGSLEAKGTITGKVDITPSIAFTCNYGHAAIMAASYNIAMSAQLAAELTAKASVFVELRPPSIPVVSDLVKALRSVPVISWAIPSPGSFTLHKEWAKEYTLASKTIDWNLARTVKLSGGSPDAEVDDSFANNAPSFKGALDELAAAGTGDDVPAQEEGPDGLDKAANPPDVESAKASATGQLGNTKKEIQRERDWNKAAADKAAAAAAKSPAPQQASAGGGGSDPVTQLADRNKALDEADQAVAAIEGAVTKADNAAAAKDSPSRAEAHTVYDSAGANADKLGDAVTAGEGKFARPATDDKDPAAEAAFDNRRKAIQLRLDGVSDPVVVEASWVQAELELTDGCAVLSDYRGKLAQHQQSVQTLSARMDMVEKDLHDAWTTALAGDYKTGNAKLDEVDKWLGWVEGQCKALSAKRPTRPWDPDYAAPEGGKLMIHAEYRGNVRYTFYPHDYRPTTKTLMAAQYSVGPHPTKPDGKTYWTYPGAKSPRGDNSWLLDDKQEKPTVDHKPPVAVHWNTIGNGTDSKGRADYYNGDGVVLKVMPQTLNSSEGSGGVECTNEVKLGFRG